jgi:hypothetical protein
MNFPQDGGLSCVTYHLRTPTRDTLESLTLGALKARSKIVGRLNCHHCGEVDSWTARFSPSGECFQACCGCNGSVLPVYIGPPPSGRHDDWVKCRCSKCHVASFTLVLGIGYLFPSVPKLGTLDVERAVAVGAGLRCRSCQFEFVGWELNRPQPPDIVGDEPWLRRIQGLHRG